MALGNAAPAGSAAAVVRCFLAAQWRAYRRPDGRQRFARVIETAHGHAPPVARVPVFDDELPVRQGTVAEVSGLARVVCADRELLDDAEVSSIADSLCDAQVERITSAIHRVCTRHPSLHSPDRDLYHAIAKTGRFDGQVVVKIVSVEYVPERL